MSQATDNALALPSDLQTLRVLVVDDNEFVLDFVEALLASMGISSIHRATDGGTALASMRDSPDAMQLIICDLDMWGMDGIEFLRNLASQQFEGAIIVMSGSDARILRSVTDLAHLHRLRFLAAFHKPVKPAELHAALLKLAASTPQPAGSGIAGVYDLDRLTPDEVRQGLAAGCVEVFLQPKVPLNGQGSIGAECLLRWRHPQRGLVSPLAVVPVAEESGLITALTLEIFRQAMKLLSDWNAAGEDITLSVNLSMDNLSDLSLPDALADIARRAGADPSRVILEITESRLMTNPAASFDVIPRLRLRGFGLSIDDFGTGYSNLEKLKQMPFTELKIDRTFVSSPNQDLVARAILESSIKLGHSIGLKVVAEGVSSPEEWDLVRTMGCDEAQGYFIAQPMAPLQFDAWLAGWKASQRRHTGED